MKFGDNCIIQIWVANKPYTSLTEVRQDQSLLNELGANRGELVLRQYAVTRAIPVREGMAGR